MVANLSLFLSHASVERGLFGNYFLMSLPIALILSKSESAWQGVKLAVAELMALILFSTKILLYSVCVNENHDVRSIIGKIIPRCFVVDVVVTLGWPDTVFVCRPKVIC